MSERASRQPAPGPGDDGPDGGDVDAAPPSWRNAWPFFVALGVVVLLAGGIGLSYLLRPASERAGDDAQVQYAISGYYTARNDVDYAQFRAHTCAADLAADDFVTEEEFVTSNRESAQDNGRIVIPEITELVVNGDRATAQVHWHYNDTPDQTTTTPTTVVREDGEWKVCTS